MVYILHQQDRVPIRIQSKKSWLQRIFFHQSCLRCYFFHTIFLSVGYLISVSCLVYRFIGFENDSNSNNQWSQRHNLLKGAMKKVSNNKPPSSNQTSWNTNRTTPIQLQNSWNESTYVITRNIIITTTKRVFILLCFHAISSRLLLNPWHSIDPEAKVHLFLLELKPNFCPTSCPWWSPTSSTHHIPLTVICAQSEKNEF